MAGNFGYEVRHQAVSQQMTEAALLPAIRRAPDALLVAEGTSCLSQIAHGTQRQAQHVALLLASLLVAGVQPAPRQPGVCGPALRGVCKASRMPGLIRVKIVRGCAVVAQSIDLAGRTHAQRHPRTTDARARTGTLGARHDQSFDGRSRVWFGAVRSGLVECRLAGGLWRWWR
jgi:hypothetical protein